MSEHSTHFSQLIDVCLLIVVKEAVLIDVVGMLFMGFSMRNHQSDV